ncbi:MAG: hypothetical protein A2142_01310 [candidate division Zixibacteria bacterium RBG_16_48_11]|nr:MAG: hypothetical protein A2142_01310 [candidate division Zixibacteria bacterium RBG_16_48_11]
MSERILRGTILILGLLLSMATESRPAGTKSYQFLKIGTSARSAAMGGAFTAVADDEAALYYNPAGIANFKQPAIIATYANYLTDIQSGFLGYLRPLLANSVIGASVTYFTYGDIPETDRFGTRLGTFGSSDLAFNLSYALAVDSQFNVGATGKVVYEKIQDFYGYGIALDLGGLYALADGRTKIGGVVQNLGSEMNAIGDEKGGLPTVFKLGLSHVLKESRILFSAEANKPVDNDFFFNFGAEISQIQPLLLRAGWSSSGSDLKTGEDSDKWAGFGFGVGLRWERLKIDYAYSSFAALGGVHRFTFSGLLK